MQQPVEPAIQAPAPEATHESNTEQENPEKRIEELARNFVAPAPVEQPKDEPAPPSGPPAPLI